MALSLWVALAQPATTHANEGQVTEIVLADALFGSCNEVADGVLKGSFRIIAYNSAGEVMNALQPISFDIRYSANESSGSITQAFRSSDRVDFALALAPSAIQFGNIAVALSSNPSIDSGNYQWDCLTGRVRFLPPVARDGRINAFAGDLVNVVYPSFDPTGKPALMIYRVIPDETEFNFGVFAGFITHAQIAPFLDLFPEENTLVAQVDKTRLFRLTSGEFQLVIGPDDEGKFFHLVFEGIPPRNVQIRMN